MVNAANTAPADKILRYAGLIKKMAHGAFMDTEDREALYALASEIEAERELELQERLVPSLGPEVEVMEYAV
jgi:hypothetical protein